MKKIIPLLLLVGLLFASAGAFAQEDHLSPPPESAKMSGWDNGFWIRSADDMFKFKIGALVQFEQLTEIRQGLARSANKPPPDKFNDTFLMRRANLATSGTLFEKVDFSAILNTSTGATSQSFNFFSDFTYNFLPTFRVSGGTIGIPLDMLGEASSRWFLTVEPPLVATQEDGQKLQTIARQSFGAPADLGLRMEGDIFDGHLNVQAAATNGAGFKSQNTNNDLSYGGRMQYNVWEAVDISKEGDFAWSENAKLSFNVGTMFEDKDAPDTFLPAVTHKWAWTTTGGAEFRWRGFALNAEGYLRDDKVLAAPGTLDVNNNGKLRDTGYYANGSYFVIPKKLEIALTASQVMREGPDNDANEFGGGINWYIFKNNVKWQIDYTNVLDYDDVAGLNNATYHRFRTMFSVMM
ncbi:MAG: hypothetical protein Q7T03_06595 [Deltaproteobacteria bacterium]|nr:hypothetical protein [Deltaproteobacteria bacterium]